MNLEAYCILLILLPMAGALLQALAGKTVTDALGPKIGRWIMGALAVLPIALAFGLACLYFVDFVGKPYESRLFIHEYFDWISLQSLRVPLEIRVDTLSLTMTLIVTGIGSLIHLYATGYMAEERDYTRFFTYLNLFIGFMLLLVLGNNLLLLFVGWEGVGLCSYLLIGFWYQDLENARAANKAFIVNRIGDYGLTLGIFLIAMMMASQYWGDPAIEGRLLSYDVILPRVGELLAANPFWATVAALLLFVGAMGKSAQFPLYIWLPDAMAGPTPVSALIHAATMVTAGVFLLNRMWEVFSASATAMFVVAVIGTLTALIGALIAFGQTDIKKVLAFSTVSQLGYMFLACGVGAYWAGIFHVTTHAFFKALLFLGSGAVIHAMAHDQDLRNYGRLFKWIKITAFTMIIGWLAIAGLPPLAGFFSKEAILGAAVNFEGAGIAQYTPYLGWVGFLVALLTAAYMTRMTMLTFYSGKERWKELDPHHHSDSHGEPTLAETEAPEPIKDEFGFFMTDEEYRLKKERMATGHHHSLGPDHEPHEVGPSMWIPLALLAVLSVVGGYLMYVVYPIKYWLYPGLKGVEQTYSVSVEVLIAISLVSVVLGVGWGLWRYAKSLPENQGFDKSKWPGFLRLSYAQFGIDRFFTSGSLEFGETFGRAMNWIDKNIIDGLVRGVGVTTELSGHIVKSFQTGRVRWYALVMMAGIAAILGYVAYVLLGGGL